MAIFRFPIAGKMALHAMFLLDFSIQCTSDLSFQVKHAFIDLMLVQMKVTRKKFKTKL